MAKRILLIEDEIRLQETLAVKFRGEGYEVFSAMDGESGLEMAEEKKPDLIVLDLILPKKDGFRVIEDLKNKPETKDIPIIVLTNLEGGKDIERCLAFGVHSYLAKTNYTLEEIAQKVGEVFRRMK